MKWLKNGTKPSLPYFKNFCGFHGRSHSGILRLRHLFSACPAFGYFMVGLDERIIGNGFVRPDFLEINQERPQRTDTPDSHHPFLPVFQRLIGLFPPFQRPIGERLVGYFRRGKPCGRRDRPKNIPFWRKHQGWPQPSGLHALFP
jgi:hypothetical protein